MLFSTSILWTAKTFESIVLTLVIRGIEPVFSKLRTYIPVYNSILCISWPPLGLIRSIQCYMKMLCFYFQNPYFCKVNSYFLIFRGSFISIGGIPNSIWKCLVFLDTGSPVFTFRMLIFAKLILFFRYLGGHIHLHWRHPQCLWKCLVFLETWTPIFTSRISISAKLFLIFRYLGGNLYPFASEASPILYENAWYFWRMEHPFLLPELLFLRN